ncbi:cell wall protein AWA1-like isoform X3 [Cygnus olor]|uniref:cell wall protein AWA1-like isoform X3 n=1 Tax=Cygnus olor TaxID=8869 RepID=UPI001ADE825B|nr:cell wall protein AWA1-like isoform X3 [Cygnus olor]XP_040425115.1 cell wall protein AWA1-like isoform X3 [Cygnus olor]
MAFIGLETYRREFWDFYWRIYSTQSSRHPRSNASFVASEGPPSPARRRAVNAASISPAPRRENVSPSSLGGTGPSAGSTALSRQCRQLQSRTPPASSAWTLWGTASPTTPWCAQPAVTPGSTGAASRDKLCAQAFSASSAPSAETGGSFVQKCSSWGSESHSGSCPSALLSRHEGTSAAHGQGLDNFPPFSRRRPTWENNDAFASLRERHQRCDVSECLYPQGREQAEGQGPWQLLLCRSCAAEGTHRRCSNLTNSAGTWECGSCAGVGTASSANLGLAGPTTSSKEALGPSRGSPAPESSSLSSASSQAAPGPSHSSQVTERRRPGTEQRTICQPVRQAQDTCNDPGRSRCRSSRAAEPSAGSSTPSLASQRAPGTSSHSLVPEGRHPASQRGRPRTRSRSPLERPAPDPQSRPRRRHRSSRAPQTGAGSSSSARSARRAASGSPSGSPGPKRRRCSSQQGTAQRRSRSPLQHQAPNTQRQTRRRHRSRRATTPSAQSSSDSSSSSSASGTAPGTSSRSTVPKGRHPASQRGRPRTRSRSPLERPAPDPQSRPRRRLRSSRAPQTGAGSSSSARSARRVASGSPSGSPGPKRRRCSSQQGTAQRSRSPLQHQAPNTQRQTRRRRGSRHNTGVIPVLFQLRLQSTALCGLLQGKVTPS